MANKVNRAFQKYIAGFSFREMVITLLTIAIIGGVVSITTAIVFREEIFANYGYHSSKNVSEQIDVILAQRDIHEIEIYSSTTPIYLQMQMKGQHLGGKIQYDYSVFDKEISIVTVSHEVSGKKLRIDVNETNVTADMFGDVKSANYVTLYIPASYDNKITIHNESGSIRVEGRFENIACANEGGHTSINGAFGTLEAHSEAGNIFVTGHAKQAKVVTEAGNIDYNIRTTAQGNAIINAESGNIDINIPDENAVYCNLESEVGNIYYLERALSGIGGHVQVGNKAAKSVVTAKTEVGDIRIRIEKGPSSADEYLKFEDYNDSENNAGEATSVEATSVQYTQTNH